MIMIIWIWIWIWLYEFDYDYIYEYEHEEEGSGDSGHNVVTAWDVTDMQSIARGSESNIPDEWGFSQNVIRT